MKFFRVEYKRTDNKRQWSDWGDYETEDKAIASINEWRSTFGTTQRIWRVLAVEIVAEFAP